MNIINLWVKNLKVFDYNALMYLKKQKNSFKKIFYYKIIFIK